MALTYPVSVHTAILDKVVGYVLRSPRQFGQTRMDLLVEEFDSLFKQATRNPFSHEQIIAHKNCRQMSAIFTCAPLD